MTTAATGRPLAAFWNQHAFSVGDTHFQWLDVAMAAMAHGDWPAFERRLTEGLACAAKADAEQTPPDDATVEAAAVAFRYERDLISGEDLGSWLDHAGISVDEWMAWVRRDVLRRTWMGDVDELVDRFSPSPRQLEAAAVTEGICTGAFATFERSFAGRAAALFESDGELYPLDVGVPGAHDARAVRLARQHAHWLAMRPESERLSRLAAVIGLESRFAALAEGLATPESLLQAVEVHRLDWVRLELETLTFANEDAAREALLCVTADGLSLNDVAGLSRQSVRRTHWFLQDLPQTVQERLLSVPGGQACGPLEGADGRYEVSTVVSRIAPSLEDDLVAERARREAVAHACRRAARDLVRRRGD
ncbi:MAG TPA: hypothetical protein VIY56_00465 [Vicinamibacterales bacterium]